MVNQQFFAMNQLLLRLLLTFLALPDLQQRCWRRLDSNLYHSSVPEAGPGQQLHHGQLSNLLRELAIHLRQTKLVKNNRRFLETLQDWLIHRK